MLRIPPLILASSSPRRRELLQKAGFCIEVVPSAIDEGKIKTSDPIRRARLLAQAKVKAVSRFYPRSVVLGADTIVVRKGKIFGKPQNFQDAWRMLSFLKGGWHRVVTGVAVKFRQKMITDHSVTYVCMRDYTCRETEAYIRSARAMDKAGAYAIQDDSFRPVSSWQGCHCNIVGLPLGLTLWMLGRAGIKTTARPRANLAFCRDCPQYYPKIEDRIYWPNSRRNSERWEGLFFMEPR